MTVTPTDGLVSGQTIAVDATATSGTMTQAQAHVCDPAIGTVNQFKFTSDLFCPNVTLTGGDIANVKTVTTGAQTTEHLDVLVGTGHAHWTSGFDSSVHDLDCDVTHSCSLVIQFASSVSPGTFYFTAPLTYAGTPGAPADPITAVAGDGTAHVTWGAAPPNNSTIDHYVITATRTSGAADGSSPRHQTVGNVLSGDIALNNFSVYTITVHAHVSQAIATPDGPESSPVANVSPLPAGPTNVQGAPAASSVNVTWTAPAFTTGLGSYEVTATPNVGSPIVQCSNSTNTFYNFAPLDNGTPYTFVVRASYSAACGGPFGLPSNAGSQITPSNIEVDQLISVDRPQGALVLTQACDTSNPTPYPVDGSGVPNPVYPTDPAVAAGACSINLGHATFVTADTPAGGGYPAIGEGQFFRADGAIHEVTIIDTRDTDPSWTVNAVLTGPFTSGSNHFSAHQLGMQPQLTDHSAPFATPDQPYNQVVNQGPDVLPASHAADTALGSSRVLAQAPTAGHGLGIAHLNAVLHLLIPVWAVHGVYTATLQVTAI